MLYNASSIPVLLFAGVIAEVVGLSQLMVMMAIALLLFFWWGSRYIRQDMQAVTLGPSH